MTYTHLQKPQQNPKKPQRPMRTHSSSAPRLQARLGVSQSNDPLEREAEQIATRIVSVQQLQANALSGGTSRRHGVAAPDDAEDLNAGFVVGAASLANAVALHRSPTAIQRRCMACEDEDEGEGEGEEAVIQRRAVAPSQPGAPLDAAALSRVRTRGGVRLPPALRQSMETSMGYDLSPVRLHLDSDANVLARRISAQAFTFQHDIFFGTGQYRPHTRDGQHLIAHELVHTAQQGATWPVPAGALPVSRSLGGDAQARLLTSEERANDPRPLKQAKRRANMLWRWVEKIAEGELASTNLRQRWARWVLMLADAREPRFSSLVEPHYAIVVSRLHAILEQPEPADSVDAILEQPEPADSVRGRCPDLFSESSGAPCEDFGADVDKTVQAALAEGKSLVDSALAELPVVADAGTRIQPAFELLLGQWNDENLREVRKRLTSVCTRMGEPHTFKCLASGSTSPDAKAEPEPEFEPAGEPAPQEPVKTCGESVIAFVTSGVSNVVNLCPLFFCSEKPRLRPLTLIHEFVHLDDPDNKGPDLYDHEEGFYNIALLPGQFGLRNPDSLMMFVEVASGAIDMATLVKRQREAKKQALTDKALGGKVPLFHATMTLARAWITSGLAAVIDVIDPYVGELLQRFGLTRDMVKNEMMAAMKVLGSEFINTVAEESTQQAQQEQSAPKAQRASQAEIVMRIPKDKLLSPGGELSRTTIDRITALTTLRVLVFAGEHRAKDSGKDPNAVKPPAYLPSVVEFLRANFYASAPERFFVVPQE